ncbi:MAG: polyprenyl synthetase family protein [Paludibacter sp.]|jgi:octaprenyl-diphosphate synthase
MSLTESIRQPIEQELKTFKQFFENSLKTDNPLLAEINGYIIENSGKKLRPILTFLSAGNFGKINDNVYYAALSMELLHNASLIHDDVVDDTHERRGRSSVNARWSNKVAVLTGDYMLSTALICGAKTNKVAILKSIANIGMELADGELLQLNNMQKTNISEDEYFKIIQKKTALLFATCTEIGAIAAEASPEMQKIMFDFGENLGICFQIKDDIFDYYNDIEIGKPTGNDLQDGKVTLPLIYALQNGDETERAKVITIIQNKDFTAANIDYIMQYARQSGGVSYAESKIAEYKQKAMDLLNQLPMSDYKKSLEFCLEYTSARKH